MHAPQRHAAIATARPHRRPATALAAFGTVVALLLAGASAADADVLRRSSGADIKINDGVLLSPGAATPYPATLAVSNQPADRKVVGVRVKLDDITHASPEDLDVALVGPNGQGVVLMSDVGGTFDLNGDDLTFDDETDGVLPPGDPISPGIYRPTDNDVNQGADQFPSPAPAAGGAARLDALEGIDPNGAWKLFVVDDSGGDTPSQVGTIGGWQLTIETGPAPRDAASIAIPDDGSAPTEASPYGVPLEIAGVRGRVAEASVVLHGLRHDDPGDVDVMLEGPLGTQTTLMSDAGGVTGVTGKTLRFDDDSDAVLSDTVALETGTYKPTNLQGADAFPAPAPSQPDDTGLDVFDSLDPNGTWKLWVMDDANGGAGALDGGWTLQLELEPYVELIPNAIGVAEGAGPTTVTVKRPEGGGAATVKYSVSSDRRQYDVQTAAGTLTFGLGEKTKTFTATVLDDTAHEESEFAPLSLHTATGDAGFDNLKGSGSGSLDIQDDDAADVRNDFNGDGRADLATGVPGENVGTDADAGLVSVVYGTANGLAATGNQRFTQDTAGVPDATEPGDRFGAAVASGDFDADGFADLAVGAPGEELANPADAGTVTILYGSAAGLTATGSALLHQDSASVPGTSEAGDRFGEALAAGNFGRTAHSDLAVGHPGEDVGAANGAGTVTALYGGANGLSGTAAEAFNQDISGFPDTAESGDALGASLAAGDLGRGAESDLAIGAPGENAGAGVAHVLYGSPAGGVGLTGTQLWSQSSAGVADGAAAGDGFGSALAVSASQYSRTGQLAIGAPGEDIGAASDAGVVHVLGSGEDGGVTAAMSGLWAQSAGSMLDSPESGDRFGAALAWGDLGTLEGQLDKSAGSKIAIESPDDLAIGVPGETLSGVQAGAMAILYADESAKAESYLTSDENQLWHQNSTDVLDSNQAGDQYGAVLSTIEGGSRDAIGIGVPGEASGAGAVATLRGGSIDVAGPSGNLRFKQGAGGMLDTAEAGDGFGSAISR